MSDPKANINIRFEVQIPVGVTATVQPVSHEATSAPQNYYRQAFLDPNIESMDPDDDSTKLAWTRSGSALGLICAQVVFKQAVTVGQVLAKVYPEANATPHADPPSAAEPGRNTTGKTWVWSDAFTSGDGKPVGSVDHLPDGSPLNTFTIWYRAGTSGPWTITQTQFHGRTGQPGNCGSGSGSGVPEIVSFAATIPAYWCIEISGLTGREALLNNSYALRTNRGAVAPTWESQGDGHSSPRLELRLLPQKHEWTLVVQMGGDRFIAKIVSHTPLAPLFFPLETGQVRTESQRGPRVIAFPLV